MSSLSLLRPFHFLRLSFFGFFRRTIEFPTKPVHDFQLGMIRIGFLQKFHDNTDPEARQRFVVAAGFRVRSALTVVVLDNPGANTFTIFSRRVRIFLSDSTRD